MSKLLTCGECNGSGVREGAVDFFGDSLEEILDGHTNSDCQNCSGSGYVGYYDYVE